MDPRTTMRELDEVITIASVTVEREAAKMESLPHARRHARQRQVRGQRDHVQRLRELRTLFKRQRRLATLLR